MNLTRFRAGAFALALILLPRLAMAQSTPVYQSGTIAAAHDLAKMTRNGQVQDASPRGLLGDNNGRGINPFPVQDSLGLGLCSNSAVTSGNYNAICLGHDASGNGLITLDSYGVANAALKFRINGSPYTFPGNGQGNVLGPDSSTVNNLAFFNNTTGTLVADNANLLTVAQSTAITTTGKAFGARSYNGVTQSAIATPIEGGNDWDAVQGVVRLLPGSTVKNAQAFGGYVSNQAASSGVSGNGAVFFGIATCEANNCASWGMNTITTGGASNVIDAQTGRKLIGYEADISAHSAGDIIQGVAMLGSSLIQPAASTGFTVGQLDSGSVIGTVARWTTGFACIDAVVLSNGQCLLVGALNAAGTNVAGQRVVYGYRDSGGASQQLSFQITTGGNPTWSDSGTGHDMTWNMATVLGSNGSGANSPGYASLYNYIDGAVAPQHYQVAVGVTGIFVVNGSAALGTARIALGAATQVGSFLTVAGLPACASGLDGYAYTISDANSTTFNAVAAGGGTNRMLALCDGSNWRLH